MDALEWAGTILAKTLAPSFKLVPSTSMVMLPVSSHRTAWLDRLRRAARGLGRLTYLLKSIPRNREVSILEIQGGQDGLRVFPAHGVGEMKMHAVQEMEGRNKTRPAREVWTGLLLERQEPYPGTRWLRGKVITAESMSRCLSVPAIPCVRV